MQVAENHQRARKRPSASSLLAPAVLFLITVSMFWKLVLTDQYTWLESPDLSRQVLPWWQFQAGEFHAGRFPLWDPNHWFGQPLLGQAQPGTAYPPNWLFFSLPSNRGWLKHYYLNWYYVLARFLAALFCYWLCRDLGRSRTASIVAGCVFAFSGFLGTIDWPQMFNGAIWTPLVFLFIFRAWRGERPLASGWLAGFFLGIAWLSGHHQIPIYVSVTASFLWLYVIYENRQRAAAFALFLIATAVTGALQTLPAIEYGRHAHRWVGAPETVGWKDKVPYTVHAEFSTPAASLVSVILPGKSVHTDPFTGPTAFVLAAVGVWAGFALPSVRALTAIGLFGLLMALGHATFLHGVLYSVVPMFEKARSPSMAVLVFNFSIAALTAWGIDRLIKFWRSARVALALAIFGGAIVAIVRPEDNRIFMVGLTSLMAAGALVGLRGQARALAIGLVVLLELSTVCGAMFPNRHHPELTSYLRKMPEITDTVEFLRTRKLPLRVEINDEDVPYNMGDFYGVEQTGGYLASLTANVHDLESHNERMQQLLGVGYLIASKPSRPEQAPLFEGQHGLKVFEKPEPLPRARVVRRFVRVAGAAQVRAFIANHDNDLATTAVMTGSPPIVETCSGPDDVRFLRLLPGEVRLKANLSCRGMVVLADTWFPGWRATVDGRPVEIHEVYGALRGVVVDGGTHTIEMTYRPSSAVAGGVLTLAGLASGLVLCLIGRR